MAAVPPRSGPPGRDEKLPQKSNSDSGAQSPLSPGFVGNKTYGRLKSCGLGEHETSEEKIKRLSQEYSKVREYDPARSLRIRNEIDQLTPPGQHSMWPEYTSAEKAEIARQQPEKLRAENRLAIAFAGPLAGGAAAAADLAGANPQQVSSLLELGVALEGAAAAGLNRPKAQQRSGNGTWVEKPRPNYVYDAKSGRYRDTRTGQFAAAKDLPWPDNAGFSSSSRQTVEPGTVLDRYGKESGFYLGEPGATVSERGMASGSEGMPYSQYRVMKPLDARMGPAAPVSEFGATGGANQYLTNRSIEQLVKDGFLERIK